MAEVIKSEKHITYSVTFDKVGDRPEPWNKGELRIKIINKKINQIEFIGDDKGMGTMEHVRRFNLTTHNMRNDLFDDFIWLFKKAIEEGLL